MKKKLFYFSIFLIVIAFILLLNLKSVQAAWYDYIDPSVFWDYLGSWGLQDVFSYYLQDIFDWAFGYYGFDIIYWLLGFY